MNVLDVKEIRRDFPIFQRPENRDWVYLDSAATTQKPMSMLTIINRFYISANANAHRGSYRLAENATAQYEANRERVRQFLNAASTEEIVFNRNTTESINLVAMGWAAKFCRPGDEILITEMEHHSNLVPWQIACQRTGARLHYVEFDDQGYLNLDQYRRLLSTKTRLVAFAHIANSLGVIHPVQEMIRLAHQVGALVLLDAAQSAPHMRLDVQALSADFVAFSSHKMLGPQGLGVLYGRKALLAEMDPLLFGGSMISRVEHDRTSWNELPWKFEAGTQNVGAVFGLVNAMDYLDKIGLDAIEAHAHELTALALQQLAEMPQIRVYAAQPVHGPIISFNLEGVHAHDLATFLDNENIAIRAGHHCAQLAMKKLHLDATARASFYLYNDYDDVERLVKALGRARDYFKRWH